MKNTPRNLPLNAYHAIASKKIRHIGTTHKICLIGRGCCPNAIKSHSVPVASLRGIAKDGHVYAFVSPVHAELQNIYNCEYQPTRLGINEASTYFGFCSTHDDAIFSEIEKRDVEPTDNQALLFHFRAYSRAFYQNANSGKMLHEIHEAQRPADHVPTEALETVASYFQPQVDTLSILEKHFERMRSDVVAKTHPKLEYLFIRLGCVPDVMCSTLLMPLYDIEGKLLFQLAKECNATCQAMSITLMQDSVGGFLLLTWYDKDAVASAFVRTFIRGGYDINRLIAVVFGATVNFFFSESWWEKLDDERREMLMYYASVLIIDPADTSRDHIQIMYQALVNHPATYVNWPILSVTKSAALN